MRVLAVPNCFRGSLCADEVGKAIVAGAESAGFKAISVPLADGGDGSAEAWLRLRKGTPHQCTARDALGVDGPARFAMSADGSAFVEMAQASGLSRLADRPLDPWHATTFGTGELIRCAAAAGATTVLVGAGGSATLDMGAGALAALGATFRDARGAVLRPVAAELRRVCDVDLDGIDPKVRGLDITVLGDVSTPLRDNAAVYGRQKGIPDQDVPAFVAMLEALAGALDLSADQILSAPWLGAGGGLGAGLAALGVTTVPGSAYLLDLAGVDDLMADADVVVTSEGRVDAGSLDGKLSMCVARLAQRHRVPSVVLTADCRLADGGLPEGCRVLRVPGSGPAGRVTAGDLAAAVSRLFEA